MWVDDAVTWCFFPLSTDFLFLILVSFTVGLHGIVIGHKMIWNYESGSHITAHLSSKSLAEVPVNVHIRVVLKMPRSSVHGPQKYGGWFCLPDKLASLSGRRMRSVYNSVGLTSFEIMLFVTIF